jgi:hypothetical protein
MASIPFIYAGVDVAILPVMYGSVNITIYVRYGGV